MGSNQLYTSPRSGVYICRHCGAEMTLGQRRGHAKVCPMLNAPKRSVPHDSNSPPSSLLGDEKPLRVSVEMIISSKKGRRDS